MEEIQSSQNDSKKEITNVNATMADLKKTIENLITENTTLRNQNCLLVERIAQMEDQLNTIKQDQLSNNILIGGITETNEENLQDILLQIANNVGVNLKEEEIEKCYRKKSFNETDNNNDRSKMPKQIFIKFKNKYIKTKIMNAKKQKDLNTKILNHHHHRPIYINEDLTKNNQLIFKKARELKRGKKVEFAWVKNGRIYVKKHNELNKIYIPNINLLNDI